jgi:hypothetical protein
VHSWSTFGARTNHEQTWTHKTHHSPNLGETATFSFIVFSVPGYRVSTKISFCLGTPKLRVLKFPKFSKLGLLQLWRPITASAHLWLKWGMKQSYSPRQDIFNSVWHDTCTQLNQGDSWLLMIGSRIGSLIPGPFFGHNLCFKYPNGSCEPILHI